MNHVDQHDYPNAVPGTAVHVLRYCSQARQSSRILHVHIARAAMKERPFSINVYASNDIHQAFRCSSHVRGVFIENIQLWKEVICYFKGRFLTFISFLFLQRNLLVFL
jgi:hypothetical protein